MKTELTKGRAFWLSCLFSIFLFVATCWSAAFHGFAPYWVESVGFFLLTYLCIDEFSKRIPDLNAWKIGLAVILGQLIVHVPIHVIDFAGTMGSFMVAISCIIAIVLAVFCYIDKKPYTFILSYIVIVLYNTCVADMWHSYWKSLHGY